MPHVYNMGVAYPGPLSHSAAPLCRGYEHSFLIKKWHNYGFLNFINKWLPTMNMIMEGPRYVS